MLVLYFYITPPLYIVYENVPKDLRLGPLNMIFYIIKYMYDKAKVRTIYYYSGKVSQRKSKFLKKIL